MNTRIKKLRKTLKMTQSDFGSRVGVKGNTIGNYELSLRNPSNAVIHSICKEFGVNEEWLRFGKGEMFLPVQDVVYRMTQAERVHTLRKELSLTQQNFGEKLGVGKTAIHKIEKGENSLTDRMLNSICREFNVNENWLRSGDGDMFRPVEDEVGRITSRLLEHSNPFYDLILDIMQAFDKLDDKGKEIFCNTIKERSDKRKKEDD